jgi:hypothetical protein
LHRYRNDWIFDIGGDFSPVVIMYPSTQTNSSPVEVSCQVCWAKLQNRVVRIMSFILFYLPLPLIPKLICYLHTDFQEQSEVHCNGAEKHLGGQGNFENDFCRSCGTFPFVIMFILSGGMEARSPSPLSIWLRSHVTSTVRLSHHQQRRH